MSEDLNRPVALTGGEKLTRLAFIGGVLVAGAGAFAYAGGWLSPRRVTPAKFADAFERVDGRHPGFRRNHAKGLCVSGTFDSNGAGERLSAASVFRPGRVPVVGRFSFGGGDPYAVDSPGAVRGLGLQFTTADGQQWRSAMINLPVFPVRTPQAFYDRLVAATPDAGSGKVDPAKMAAFVAAHPETVAAVAVIKRQPATAGFAQTTFNSINAFRFTSAAGVSSAVRWALEPVDGPTTRPSATRPSATRPGDANALFDALIERVARGPVRWRLVVVVAGAGDPTADATLPWPADRERVDVGTVTVDRAEAEADSPTASVNFDPLVLPPGMAPSDDPLLSARSAVYSQSFTRRAAEAGQKPASAVTPAEVHADGGPR